MTLSEFLLARIAEDEADAKVATPGAWWAAGVWYHDSEPYGDPAAWPVVGHGSTGADVIAHTARRDGGDAVHIARHNPARVLAECEAKRQALSAIVSYENEGGIETFDLGYAIARALALPYVDHPDYDPRWRP